MCGVSLKTKNLPEHLLREHPSSPIRPICHRCGEPMIDVSACDELLDKCIDLVEEGKFENAADILKRIPEGYPRMDEVCSLLGIALHEMGEERDSLLYFKRAVEFNAEHYGHWYNLGTAYFEAGNLSKAMECLNRTLKLNPEEDTRKSSKELLEGIKKVIEMELKGKPDLDVETWLRLAEHFTKGVEYLESDELDLAAREFSHISSVDKRSEKALGNLGLICLLKGEFDKAEEYLNRALEINPTYTPALNNLLKLQEAREMIKKKPGYLAILKKHLVIEHF